MTTALKIIDIPNMAGVLTVLLEDLHELETKDNLFENVATIIDEVDDALMNAQSKLQEIKKEEIVEEVKPKLRRETFENSSLLRRVGLTKLWNINIYKKKTRLGGAPSFCCSSSSSRCQRSIMLVQMQILIWQEVMMLSLFRWWSSC